MLTSGIFINQGFVQFAIYFSGVGGLSLILPCLG